MRRLDITKTTTIYGTWRTKLSPICSIIGIINIQYFSWTSILYKKWYIKFFTIVQCKTRWLSSYQYGLSWLKITSQSWFSFFSFSIVSDHYRRIQNTIPRIYRHTQIHIFIHSIYHKFWFFITWQNFSIFISKIHALSYIDIRCIYLSLATIQSFDQNTPSHQHIIFFVIYTIMCKNCCFSFRIFTQRKPKIVFKIYPSCFI